MIKKINITQYSVIFVLSFFFDRWTKYLALNHAQDGYEISSFLSFDLVFNRGVTAGMLKSDSMSGFIALSAVIIAVACVLVYYTYRRWQQGAFILGEVLTISGALSNIIDRFLYQGVVDFIHISFGGWSFPIFNCADAYIVLGVLIIFFVHMKE